VSYRSAAISTIVIFSVGACLLQPLAAQTVNGKALESGTRRPLVLARITLLDTAMVVVDQTYSNESGGFTLRAKVPGSYYISADRVGYSTRIDGILDLGSGGSISIEFYLRPKPIALGEISVDARRKMAGEYLGTVGYTERQLGGQGWFLTPDQIVKSGATEMARLLRSAPGARVFEQGAGTTIAFRGFGTPKQGDCATMESSCPNQVNFGVRQWDPMGYCTPRVLVDGSEMRAGLPELPGASIDATVSVGDVLAVEVHNGPATLPLAYAGSSVSCTTILIWTIQGRKGG
jgi:hypothetical protein